MFKTLISTLAFLGMFLGFSLHAHARDARSQEDAVAMVKKAVAYLKTNGKEKTLAAISNPSGPFRDGELYVVANDLNARHLANPAIPKLIGMDLSELRDNDGKYFMKELVDLAKTKGKGWVEYRWQNPATKELEKKATYIERVDDLILGCGVYR